MKNLIFGFRLYRRDVAYIEIETLNYKLKSNYHPKSFENTQMHILFELRRHTRSSDITKWFPPKLGSSQTSYWNFRS